MLFSLLPSQAGCVAGPAACRRAECPLAVKCATAYQACRVLGGACVSPWSQLKSRGRTPHPARSQPCRGSSSRCVARWPYSTGAGTRRGAEEQQISAEFCISCRVRPSQEHTLLSSVHVTRDPAGALPLTLVSWWSSAAGSERSLLTGLLAQGLLLQTQLPVGYLVFI